MPAQPAAQVSAPDPGEALVALIGRLKALDYARANLAAAGLEAETRLGPGLDPLDEAADIIVANPPFIAGDSGLDYRDGGGMHGDRLSLD